MFNVAVGGKSRCSDVTCSSLMAQNVRCCFIIQCKPMLDKWCTPCELWQGALCPCIANISSATHNFLFSFIFLIHLWAPDGESPLLPICLKTMALLSTAYPSDTLQTHSFKRCSFSYFSYWSSQQYAFTLEIQFVFSKFLFNVGYFQLSFYKLLILKIVPMHEF